MSSPEIAPSPPLPQLDLADIQGVVLRAYRMPFLRNLVLRIDDASRVKAALSTLSIQNAECWESKPEFCLNIGFTADGLRALGVPSDTLQTFPAEFLEGAVARAAVVGDTGINDPSNWIAPFQSSQIHVLLSLSAQSQQILESITARIREEWNGAGTEVFAGDGYVLSITGPTSVSSTASRSREWPGCRAETGCAGHSELPIRCPWCRPALLSWGTRAVTGPLLSDAGAGLAWQERKFRCVSHFEARLPGI